MMHWGNFSSMGNGGFGIGWIFAVLFWVMVILGIVYFIKQLRGSTEVIGAEESAQHILKKRYAAGEITKDEYKDKLLHISKLNG